MALGSDDDPFCAGLELSKGSCAPDSAFRSISTVLGCFAIVSKWFSSSVYSLMGSGRG